MFSHGISAFILVISVSLVLSKPGSEVESLTGNEQVENLDTRLNPEVQLKNTLQKVQDDIEKMKKLLDDARMTFASNVGSDKNIQNILEMHDRISNLTMIMMSQINPLKEQGKLSR